ncbi:ER lumen protein-retaining receptor [Carica papaya]|uniref:ER lumen protein-retaining receptor n=1 Tax=Carica papaya TaxID=3649 RepID=UPI000B8C808D|nr:ER lumen protein-retaining receptor [Carica papaya]
MGQKRDLSRAQMLSGFVRRQSMKVKILMGVTLFLCALVGLRLLVKDNIRHFFVAAEVVHAAGILVLIYKLTKTKTCSGLSLKSQELTAIFLAVRLACSTMIEADIHTVLDFATIVSTGWVIYMIRRKLKATYIKELDDMPIYYLLVPCAILAVIIHPYTHHSRISRIMWAFSVFLESVSVAPQLRMMQKAKMIEPFTAHYVFALGVARFFACAHWIIQIYVTRGTYLFFITAGYFWFPVALLAEIVQTFILADFCYYYVKSVMDGHLILRMPI